MWIAAAFNTLQKALTSKQFSSDRCSAASVWKRAAKLLFKDNFSLPLGCLDSFSNYSSLCLVCCVCKYSRSLFIKARSENKKSCGRMMKFSRVLYHFDWNQVQVSFIFTLKQLASYLISFWSSPEITTMKILVKRKTGWTRLDMKGNIHLLAIHTVSLPLCGMYWCENSLWISQSS